MAEEIKGVGVLRYPPGEQYVFNGALVRNSQVAEEIASTIKCGSVITLSGYRDEHGDYLWDFRIEGGDPGQVRIERSDVD